MVYNNPKNAAHGAILKGMGMVRGTADLIYLRDHNTDIFLECKIPGEHQKTDQIEFEKMVKELGAEYYVFETLEEFQEILKPYL